MSRKHRKADDLRIEYLALSIIPTGPKPNRSMSLMAAGVLIALAATLIVAFGR
jgi:hypothetical protein